MAEAIKKKNLKLNAILNIIKQCCNVLFPLITYPYIARILGGSGLGRYSFADSVVGYVLILASLGIPTYAVREGARIRDDRDKITWFITEIFTINLISMIVSILLLIVLTISVPRLWREHTLISILTINVFTSVCGRDWINSIFEDYLYITIRYIVFQTIALILVFLLVKTPEDCAVYTAITVVANSGGYIANIFYTRRYVKIKITSHLNLGKHLKPILLLFCSSVAITIYIKSDITILGFFRTDTEVGIYTLASKIYTIIKALLNAVIMVVIPRLANYLGSNDTESYNELLVKLLKVLCILVLPSSIGLFWLSRDTMYLLGGQEYLSGALSLSILCVALGFAVFGCFMAQAVLVVRRKESVFLRATIVSAVSNIVLNLILVPLWGISGAAFTTVLAEMMVMMICWREARKEFCYHDDRNIISVLTGCAVISSICIAVRMAHLHPLLSVLAAILLSSTAYMSILLGMKNQVALGLVGGVMRRFFRR